MKPTGQKRSRLGVVLEGFSFLGSGNRGEGGGAPSDAPRSRPAPAAAPATAAASAAGAADDSGGPSEDDVPF